VRVAAKPGFAVVFLIILALGLPLGFLPEDVPETAYDESEALPYEGTPLFSIVVVQVATRTTQEPLSFLHRNPGAPSLFSRTRIPDTNAKRSAVVRVSSALLCTLRC
jgi:hypothetical protein